MARPITACSISVICGTSRTGLHMQPKNEDEFVDMLWTMAHYNSGPIAIRYPRGSGTRRANQTGTETSRDRQGRSRASTAATSRFSAWGTCSKSREEAAQKLEEKGISVALINPRWIKPMDTGTLEFFARSVEVVCTIEDHVLAQRLRLRGDGASAFAANQHAGRAHRLAG